MKQSINASWLQNFASKALLVSIFLLGSAAAYSAENRKPNVVVLLVDDLGSDEICTYASKFHETPNIDALAAQGVKFTRAYSGAAICSPSRAALMTGRSPARLHLTDWIKGEMQINRKMLAPDWQPYMDKERVLLPEAMKEQGYATGFFGKWHLMPKPTTYMRYRNDKKLMDEQEAIFPEHYPEKNGFDENYAGDHSANQGNRFLYPETKRFYNLKDKGTEDDCITDILTDCAVDFIERKKEEPFFVYLSYYTVHRPISGKPEYVKKYKRKLVDNPNAGYHMKDPGKAAMMQSLDESVGRVVAKLKEIGQLDNTLIIFTSDNGSFSEEYVINYRGYKTTPYEGGTIVPLLVTGPGIKQSVCDTPTIGMDLYPTILSFIGAPLKPKEHVDGVDIMPVITGAGAIKDRPLYWHYPHYLMTTTPYSSAIVGDWKVIYFAEDEKLELYNLADDPKEENDLSAKHPEMAQQMKDTLMKILDETNSQVITHNPDYDPDPNKFSGGERAYKKLKGKKKKQ